ncbi:MAG: hypothetical protein WCO95_03490, partial [Actinomycetes bacterium]
MQSFISPTSASADSPPSAQTWTASTDYVPGDIASYYADRGSGLAWGIYIAIKDSGPDSPSIQPYGLETSGTYWLYQGALLTGNTGATGLTGNTGATG